MKSLKLVVAAAALLANASAWAAPFVLQDSADGTTYQCAVGGIASQPGSLAACTTKLGDFCHANTDFGGDQCFEKANDACHRYIDADCVVDMANYCNKNTDFDSDQCWDRAINSCSGRASAMQEISRNAAMKFARQVSLPTQKISTP